MPNWEQKKVAIMKEVLQLKFEKNLHCQSILLSTKDKDLCEHTATDKFW